MFREHRVCRSCRGTDLVEVFAFDRPLALANNFVKPGEEREGFVPVRVLFCRSCTLAQLGETVSPDVLYKNYLFVQSDSQTMLRHFDRFTKDILSEAGMGSLLEIGANNGAYLSFALSRGFTNVLGVDPASNLVGLRKVPMLTGFFGSAMADSIKELLGGSPDIITARHCFCHQEWHPFMQAVESVAHRKTLLAIEVPYAPNLVEKAEFDTIYSEHTSLLTAKSVVALLKHYPFKLHAALKYSIHGGAVLLMIRHVDSGIQPHLSADEILADENVTEDSWRDFSLKAHGKIAALRSIVADLRSKNKIVAMFGASAKASVMIGACGWQKQDIEFASDNSQFKPGCLVPGTDIPVIDESEFLPMHADYAIMGAWQYRDEILAKMDKWRKRGGRFIIPGKEIEIV
jgi:hypothetical protein